MLQALKSLHVFRCLRYNRAHITNWDLISLIGATRGLETSEPIDRVYGLLGMTDGSSGIAPGYSVEAREKYWELYLRVVTMEVASGKSSLFFLSFADIESKHPELPSWVPNWNRRAQVERLRVSPGYRAGLSPSDNPKKLADVRLSTPKCLRIRGFSIETIAATSPLVPEVLFGDFDAAQRLGTVEDALKIYNKHGSVVLAINLRPLSQKLSSRNRRLTF